VLQKLMKGLTIFKNPKITHQARLVKAFSLNDLSIDQASSS